MVTPYRRLPEIKLKRTDTTLDLSQKAKRAKEERKEEEEEEREGLYSFSRGASTSLESVIEGLGVR